VLMRLLAGLKVTRAELTGMGVGGLLMEIVTQAAAAHRHRCRSQPQCRRDRARGRTLDADGRPQQALGRIDGKKLVRIVAEQALASKAKNVVVVTGHQAELVEQALAGLDVKFVRNPDFAGGLPSSVKAGITAVPANATARWCASATCR